MQSAILSKRTHPMSLVHKSVALNYSARQMYALVERIEDYPRFLPWCGEVQVQRDSENRHVIATLTMQFHGLRHSFTTKNTNSPPESIKLTLLRGPFRKLEGQWTFTSLGENRCRIELNMNYEFSGWLLEKMIGPVFDIVSNNLVNSFCKRAKEVYG